MSKAVLVMDMPERCYICNFFNNDVSCMAMDNSTIDVDGMDGKPDWCPLRPMPEKKQNACTHGFAGGWNACIDAIGGGYGDGE